MEKLDKFLEIKMSSLVGAGLGVFTTIDIQPNQVICELKGRWITSKQWEKMDYKKTLYSFYINKNNILDSYSKQSNNFGRYINDANGSYYIDETHIHTYFKKNNSKFVCKKKKGDKHYRIWIVATCQIPAGSEIMVDYGEDYWPLQTFI